MGGIESVTKTDRGRWDISYDNIVLDNENKRRLWNIIRQHCGGRVGTIAVPIWAYGVSSWAIGAGQGGKIRVPYSDGASHSDGSYFLQAGIVVENVNAVAIGDTEITLKSIYNITDLSGVNFSYEHALYETGAASNIDGNDWTVSLFPAARAVIPAGALLEFDLPTCLVNLATDREMDRSFSAGGIDTFSLNFKEDVAEWNRRATA